MHSSACQGPAWETAEPVDGISRNLFWLPHTAQVLWRQRNHLRHTQGYVLLRIAASPDSAQVKTPSDPRILFYLLVRDDSLLSLVSFPNSVTQYTLIFF